MADDIDAAALQTARQIGEVTDTSDMIDGFSRWQARVQLIVAAALKAERERCAKIAEGWPTETAGDKYQTDVISFWDAGNVYDQARVDAAYAIRNSGGRPC